MPEAEGDTATAPASDKKEVNENKTETEEPVADVKRYRSMVLGAFGGSKHLRVELNELKPVGKNEIAVDVEACGINFLDVMTRQGLIDHSFKPPFVMGSECTGVVSEIGEGVTKYKVGDQVIVLLENGAWSERLVLPVVEHTEKPATEQPPSTGTNEETQQTDTSTACLILPRPHALTTAQASIFAFAYLPAYILLHHVANVRSGDIILVHSAGGGVGSAIGQLAKLVPNVKLIGTASKTKHEKLTGFYDVLLTPDQDCVAEIKKLYPQGISVVLDCLSGEEINKSYGILKPLGKYILYGMSNLVTGDRKNFLNLAKHWFHIERISPLRLHEENRLLGGFSIKPLLFPRDRNNQVNQIGLIHDAWTELTKLIDTKKIDPWVDSEWHFEEVKEAMLRLQERKNIGKVVLIPKAKEVPAEPEKPQTTEEQPKTQSQPQTS